MVLKVITDPKDLSNYHDSVGEMARSSTKSTYQDVSRKIKDALKSLWIEQSRVLITWSDARSENPIFLRKNSPGELIVTAETEGIVNAGDLNQLKKELQWKWFKIEEFKGSSDTRIFYQGDNHAVFPTRIYDAVIAENFEPSPSERSLLFKELKAHNSETIKRFTKKVKEARKAMTNGESQMHGQNHREIDFNARVIHYDKNNFQNGVKTGPLRFVQYGLMRFIMNRVRNGKSCEIDLMLPSNILARIDALKSSWILPLSHQETEDLKFAYGYLLYMHHMMQLWSLESNKTAFEVDESDMKDIKKMFVDLEKIIAKLGGE